MIFDGHSDILTALTRFVQKGEKQPFTDHYLQAFVQGQVEGAIFALWADPAQKLPLTEQIAQQLQALHHLLKEEHVLQLILGQKDLELAMAQGNRYCLLGAEGLDGYPQEEATIDWLYQQGVRHVGLTWNYANQFAAGVLDCGGLTALGKRAVKRIQQSAMLLDISHLNDESAADVLRLAQGPILASHSNCRRLCGHPRNLTDAQIKAVAATGGVVGINSYPLFIAETKQQQNLHHLADHIVHMADLAGTAAVGLGFDFNDWDTAADAVILPDLHQYSQIPRLLELLKQRGFHDSELQQICHGNFLRLLREVLA